MKRAVYVMAAMSIVSVTHAVALQAAPPGRGTAGGGGTESPTLKALYPGIKPVLSMDQLKALKIENTTIDSVTQNNGSIQVTATVTHAPENDKVKVWIGLPANWNGRFEGTGGGGWMGGSAFGINGPVSQGFAAGATDTGHTTFDGSFGLGADGKPAWQLIKDCAYQGIHDMTVVGKALTTAYYGKPPKYSYFVGFSQGGRQALSEVQRFPDDYEGVVSGCPAINWQQFIISDLWPQVAMNAAKDRMPAAKLRAATQAFITACDEVDGVKDGLVEDPSRCTCDLKALVGTQVGGSEFTATDAEVLQKIWDGPRGKDGKFLWYGLSKGADLTALGGAQPFSISMDWIKYYLVKDRSWDIAKLTPDEFEKLFHQSVQDWAEIFGTDHPDLTKFRDHGGKVLITHGQADQLIPTEGSIDYYKRVMEKMGGRDKTMEFARLFLIPGAGHGFGGIGDGGLSAVIKWVEKGTAPEKLINGTQSGGKTRTRPLFPYPALARYKGTGSTDDAANFESYLPKQ